MQGALKKIESIRNVPSVTWSGVWYIGLDLLVKIMTKNRLMVTIHSKDVTEILALYRRSEIDFPPHFLVRLMHSFPMMYNTI